MSRWGSLGVSALWAWFCAAASYHAKGVPWIAFLAGLLGFVTFYFLFKRSDP